MIYSIDILQACRRAFSWKQISTVLILAVGLTLTTAMFAVGYGYSVFSVPFKDAWQLATVAYPFTTMDGRVMYDKSGNPILDGVPTPTFLELKNRKDVFTDLAASNVHIQEMRGMESWHSLWQIKAPGQTVSFVGYDVTDNYFDLLGVSFRGLHEWKRSSETEYPVPLLVTYGTGVKDFGYDAIGKEFDSNGGKITLFGILPKGYITLGAKGENLGFSPLVLHRAANNSFNLGVVARLAPGVTPQLAEQMLSSIPNPSAPVYDDQNAARIIVKSFQEELLKPSRRIVLGAWLMGGLILILCITNVAGIYLMRCNYQLREFALKTTLGANFVSLIRPLLFELIALSVVAAVIAAIMVQGILAVIKNMVPVTNMAFGKPASGGIVLIFLLVCMAVMIVVSLIPSIIVVLKNCRHGFNGSHLAMFRSHKATRMFLIISQSAIAMLLLAISYMAVKSYLELFNKDVGVDSSVLITSAYYTLKIPDAQRGAIVNETLDMLRGGNPDIRVAACTGALFSGTLLPSRYRFENVPFVRSMDISPGFVRTVNGKLLAGREFSEKDRFGEAIILNASLAKAIGWSPQEAIGQVVQSIRSRQMATVIGVMGDFLNNSLEDTTVDPTVFQPLTINAADVSQQVHYITHPDAFRQVRNIEQTIYKASHEAIIRRHTTWDKLLDSSASVKILASFIVIVFTIAAIVIVVTGIVNTMLFTITRRTREIAIHLAIGATYGKVFWIIISDVVKAGVAGLLFGALASWWIGKSTVHFFYNGAQYQGLLELAFTAALMLLIIIIASLIPALRILRIEISRALAAE